MATEKLSVLLDGLSGKAPIDADKLGRCFKSWTIKF